MEFLRAKVVARFEGRSRPVRWVRSFILIGVLTFGGDVTAADDPTDYVMAAMVAKVARYATWADGKTLKPGSEMTLATFNRCKAFKKVLDGQKDGGVTWRVVYVSSLEEAGKHPIVFLCDKDSQPKDEWYRRAEKRGGVLTLARARGGESPRAMVEFLKVNSRLRFNVDLRIASQAGVKLSPRLLRLAHRVYR